jgi:hypothetical protein
MKEWSTGDGSKFRAAIRARNLRCPVIVFAGAVNADERKVAVLGMGALAYCHSFADLYRKIEETLSPGGRISLNTGSTTQA